MPGPCDIAGLWVLEDLISKILNLNMSNLMEQCPSEIQWKLVFRR